MVTITSSLSSLTQDFNVQQATAYFASLLRENLNDLLLSIGQYNGWFKGMTYV